MRLHREEKINRIIQRQKEMLASGEKNGPVIKKSMQRMAVQSLIIFFTLMFVCTVISRVSLSITTASVSVSTLASGTLTERAFVEGRIQAAADRSIRLPEGLWVTAVNAQEGSQVNKGDPLLAFEVPSMEEQVKKLEEEIHILTLRIELSGSGGGNEVAAAQRALEDAQREYERLASKYVRSDTRLKEDYTKSEEKLAAAETEDDRAAAAVKQELIREAEAVVKEAEENLYSVREAAEDAIHAAEKELDEASENLDASKNAYQKLLEAYNQAESTLNAAKQAVSDIEKAIEEQEPGGDTDYTEELKAAKEELSKAQEELGICLAAKQKEAVKNAFSFLFTIITGGPGTGKTTVEKVILYIHEKLRGGSVLLMAPTGRASRRMAECTGCTDASTMHSALGLVSEEMESESCDFLEADLILVDEMSMVDMRLAYEFFTRIKRGTRVVLIGDVNQLSSVGPGNVFRELIQCGAVPVTVLDQIFRQGKGSLIAANAYKMLNNSAALEYGEDFVFLPADNAECAAEIVEREYRRMTAELGIDQVQVLTPYRKSGAVSFNALNERLWSLVNPKMPGKAEMKVRGRIFREKDKVIHNKNKNEISNGDTGFITGIYLDEDNLEVSRIEFPDNRCVEYSSEDMEMIEHAYATTVHKSQGSEYSVVILPWMPMFYKMLRRNILYTAITRAKVKLILVGSKQAVYRAVHNTESDKRNTRLGEMILKERYALESREKIVPLPDADRTKYEQIAMNF